MVAARSGSGDFDLSEAALSILARLPDSRERRRHPRKKSLLPAVLVTQSGSFDCRVYDLSVGGARVEAATRVSPGQPLVLIVGSNRASGGSVVWTAEGSFGMQFSKQQDEAMIDHAGAASVAPAERQVTAPEQSMGFVEFKRYQGGPVFVNPARVLYVSAQGDGTYCEIHFGADAQVIVHGDCRRVCSQLARR